MAGGQAKCIPATPAVAATVGAKPTEDPDALESRTDYLVADLVEPAKSTALEKLGEGRPAFDIANAWMRTKLGVPVTAAEG
jgi:hypothetical protein